MKATTIIVKTDSAEKLELLLKVAREMGITAKPQDETEYLLSSPANRKALEKSLKNARKGKLVEVDIDKYLRKK